MKFKIGDKVKVINSDNSNYPNGTIVEILEDKDSQGHYFIDDKGRGGWFFSDSQVELSGKQSKTTKPKNLELLKDMPSFFDGDNEIKLKKGFVFAWDKFMEGWTSEEGGKRTRNVEPNSVKANPTWYKLTTRKPTIPPKIMIGSDEVKFENGNIKVGCQEIENSVVKQINSRLKK